LSLVISLMEKWPKSLNFPSTYIVATPKHIFTLYFWLIISKKLNIFGWHFLAFSSILKIQREIQLKKYYFNIFLNKKIF